MPLFPYAQGALWNSEFSDIAKTLSWQEQVAAVLYHAQQNHAVAGCLYVFAQRLQADSRAALTQMLSEAVQDAQDVPDANDDDVDQLILDRFRVPPLALTAARAAEYARLLRTIQTHLDKDERRDFHVWYKLDNVQARTLAGRAAAFDQILTRYQEQKRCLVAQHNAVIAAEIKDLAAQLDKAFTEAEQAEREAEQAEAHATRLEQEALLYDHPPDDLRQELLRHDENDEPNDKKRASFISMDPSDKRPPKAGKKAAFHKDTPCPVCGCDQSEGHYAAVFDRKPCVKCHSTQTMLSNKMMQWARAKGFAKPTVTWRDFKAMTMPDGILHMMNTGEGTPRQWTSFEHGDTYMCEEVAQWLAEKRPSSM